MARTLQEIMDDINNQVARKRWEEAQQAQADVRQRRADALAAGRVPRGRPRVHRERAPVFQMTPEVRREAGRRVYCPRRLAHTGAAAHHVWADGICACGAQQCRKITGHGSECQMPTPCPYHGA